MTAKQQGPASATILSTTRRRWLCASQRGRLSGPGDVFGINAVPSCAALAPTAKTASSPAPVAIPPGRDQRNLDCLVQHLKQRKQAVGKRFLAIVERRAMAARLGALHDQCIRSCSNGAVSLLWGGWPSPTSRSRRV